MNKSRSNTGQLAADYAVDFLDELAERLPALPSLVRYYDPFDERTRTIVDPAGQNIFELFANGRSIHLDFRRFPNNYACLLKQLFVALVGDGLAITTVYMRISCFTFFSSDEIKTILHAGPLNIQKEWVRLRSRELPNQVYSGVKALLRLLCQYREYGWSVDYLDFLAHLLPLPSVDKYTGIRSGDVFLSTSQESVVVRFLDEASLALSDNNEDQMYIEHLEDAAMVLCAYQFGMRPIQIAMLTMRDVRIWNDTIDSTPSVHLTFRMVKQRASSKTKPLPRRVKREWAPIFIELHRRRKAQNMGGPDRICGVATNMKAGQRIANCVRRLLKDDEFSATDLRHTAAQRLVDAGASQEELAEFLGHSDITTGLVYFETSANQAERVNKALGISEIYQRVATISHNGFISLKELADLKDEQQIAGVPHGIPIAGIGGCTSGQPTCAYNPVLSCYGCRKFMPIHELKIHEDVLSNFREVVRFFHDASRGDTTSPAYQQLQRTLAEVQSVINEINKSEK